MAKTQQRIIQGHQLASRQKISPKVKRRYNRHQVNQLNLQLSHHRAQQLKQHQSSHQLKYEGYSTADATYAVDKLKIDYNKQALKAAETYLDMMAFSRSGLIKQLKYEGYTTKQATYAVDKVGL